METLHDVAIVAASFGSLLWLYTHPTKAQRDFAARTSHVEDEEGWN